MKPRVAILGSGTSRPDLPVEPWLAPVRLSAFARTPYERLIADLGYADAAQRAAMDAQAVFINSFADYGIDAARAVLRVPVIGAGEAVLREAARLAERFAIVTVWPASMRFLYDERLRALDMASRCAAIVHCSPEAELAHVGRDDGVMERMHRGEQDMLEQLIRACRKVLTDTGAQALVLGCTCMAPVGPSLAAALPVPVLESSRIGFRDAAAAALREDTLTPTSSGTQIVALVDAWSGPVESECPVCIDPSPRSS
jgi:allantoin racemase